MAVTHATVTAIDLVGGWSYLTNSTPSSTRDAALTLAGYSPYTQFESIVQSAWRLHARAAIKMMDSRIYTRQSTDAVTRRAFLQTASGIGLGAMTLGPAFVGGCSADATDGTDSPSSDAGGAVMAALSGTFTALDPQSDSSASALTINDYIYQGLYRLDPFPPRAALEPDLALDLPEAASPTHYRIQIRNDAVFHDGSPVTAGDVAFTLNRIINPETSPLYAGFFDIIASVRASGDHEVEIELTRPTTLLPLRLAMVKVLSEAAVTSSPDALTLQPIGTGPYAISAATSDRVSLSRHTAYVGPRQITYDSIDFNIVTDESARIASLRTGDSAVIIDVPYSAHTELNNVDTINIEAVEGNSPTSIVFHCGKPPFDDVRIRQAVLYAIDRDAITETAFFGQAEPAWESYFRPNTPDYAVPDTIYSYDPDRAQDLVARSGYSGPDLDIEILVPNMHIYTAQSPIIEQNLRDIGLNPRMTPGEFVSLVGRLSEGTYSMFLTSADATALGASDLEFQIRWQWYGFVPRQLLHWDAPELDQIEALLDGALSAPDESERTRQLMEAQNLIQEQVPHGPLHHRAQLTAWSNELEDFRPTPSAPYVLFDGVRG
ncbi:ABC transporter substrate-binding protein [Jiangella asiatica]|uniref:ABC transporter substrate-binding protein n=1 Tax=Jiangella asiatica TaxID=2530372 RepID=A0A4R5C452_9ACTN|nr:ABC transporter substrate-binding protein [Jiangella asiatica]TDD94388.1 ABC transporter substrate-binding protein [Jiangella asiatica]